LICIQITPLPFGLVQSLRPEWLQQVIASGLPDVQFGFISLGVARTIEVGLFFVACAAVFLATLKLSSKHVIGLVPIFFIGVTCNGIAAALQYSLSRDIKVEGLLSYPLSAGLFANQNHFSALLYVSIPFIVFRAVFGNYLKSSILLLALNLIILLAAGSRAGVAIGLVITLLSVAILVTRSRAGLLSVFLVASIMFVYSLGAWTKIDLDQLDPEFGRAEIARTTTRAIEDNWAIGTGFGTFPKAYQMYEREEMIFRSYVNHAHNDYLEIVMEGGVAAALLLSTYIALVMWKFANLTRLRPLQKAAALGIVFLLAHSLVDYPLRTMALAVVFAVLNAILFHRGFQEHKSGGEGTMTVEHNGRTIVVPVVPA
jgi:O-antigen ligase